MKLELNREEKYLEISRIVEPGVNMWSIGNGEKLTKGQVNRWVFMRIYKDNSNFMQLPSYMTGKTGVHFA